MHEPAETRSPGSEEVPPPQRPAAPGPRAAALAAHAPALLAAAAGVAWLVHHVGAAILDPTNVDWLMSRDWALGYLGWAFHRLSPWTLLPLGATTDYPFGVGSSLAFTDSIPLVGVLLRPLSPLLPATFQYVGPWLALCYALQGFAGAKLVRLVTRCPVAQALGGALFALAPPLLHRIVDPETGHASLVAHWLLLAFLWLALAPVEAGGVRRRLAAAAALVLVATGVHPYHALAGLALALALVVRLRAVDRLVRWRGAALGAGALVAAAGLGFLAFGYLGGAITTSAEGFGLFSADLLTLVNPRGWSRVWLGLPAGNTQYEGFAWLGGGALALCVAAAGAALASPAPLAASRWRAALPALGAALLLALFSLSDVVRLAGRPVLEIGAYDWVPALGATFRASGRFVWSLHYLVLFAAVAAVVVAWRSRPPTVAAVLGAAVLLQAADVRPWEPTSLARRTPSARSEVWDTARGAYRHVALAPPYVIAGGEVVTDPLACGMPWELDGHLPAAEAALRIQATFNSAYLSRIDQAKAVAACRAQRDALLAGALDPDTIYVVHPSRWPLFRAADATCGVVDGLLACVDRSRRGPFADALRRSTPGAAR